jgi:mevalonate kinase
VVENLSPIYIYFTKELTNENAIESKENGQFVVRTQQKATTIDISCCTQSNSFWFSGS